PVVRTQPALSGIPSRGPPGGGGLEGRRARRRLSRQRCLSRPVEERPDHPGRTPSKWCPAASVCGCSPMRHCPLRPRRPERGPGWRPGWGPLGAAPLHGTGVVDKRLESGLVLLEAVDTGVDLTNSAFPGELDALSRLDLLLANGVGVAVRAREDLGDHGGDFPSIDRVNGADR